MKGEGSRRRRPAATDSGTPLLRVRDLTVRFGDHHDHAAATAPAVDGISFHLDGGETLGLVGESGSGKSATSLAILGLLAAARVSGSVCYAGEELIGATERHLRSVRGGEIAMIFQEPMTALNPVFTLGTQLRRVIRRHRRVRGRAAADAIAVDALTRLTVPQPAQRLRQYPHELSGGMRQRVLIAMALACQPRLLIADEPTTALDVTTQAHVLEQLRTLQAAEGLGLLLISHDLGVIAQLCRRVLVMYCGEIVEAAPVAELFARPYHPYTRQLMQATPRLNEPAGRWVTPAAEGPVSAAGPLPPASTSTSPGGEEGCRFAVRCPRAAARCAADRPRLRTLSDGTSEDRLDDRATRRVACHFPLDAGGDDDGR